MPDVTQDLANKTTLFYAGNNPTDPLYIAAKAISKDASNPLTIMGNTKLSELMHSDEVIGYLKEIAEKNKIAKYTDIMNDETTIDGVKSRALWDDASEALAKASSGDVRTLTPFGTEDKVFARVELPALLENPNVKTIDGIPREVLKTMYDADIASGLSHTEAIDNARAAVQAKSLIYTSLIDEITNANGKVIYEVSRFIDGPNNLSDYTKGASVTPHADTSIIYSTLLGDTPSTSLLNQSQIEFLNRGKTQLERVELVTQQLAQNVSIFESKHLLNLAKGAGLASLTIGLLAVTENVEAAETPEQKQQIIDDWVAHTTAEWIAGSIGSALLVGGVATLTAVSAPVTLGLAIVGGIVGSIVGGDTVYGYIKNGVHALLNDIKTWLFGEKTVSSNGLSNYEESAHLFDLAQKTYRSDPLTLDLNHDGLETRAPSISSPIMFDHTGTGIRTSTGWVLPDDGFLVLDRNGNGTIDNGTELFGDSTLLINGSFAKNGFEALADQDTNQDGKVDAQDANWLALKVWRDLNQDGISQANELFSMSALDIDGIHVTSSGHSQILENGNEIAELGTYYKTNGNQEVLGGVSHMADVNLVNDTFHRAFTDNIAISPEVALLPNMIGAGKLRDLHEAMMQSEQLKTLVQQFSIETDYLAQRSLVQNIIKAWVETDTSYQSIEQRAATEDATIFWSNIDNYRYFNHIEDNSNPDKPIYDQLWQNLQIEWNYKLRILEEFNGRYYFKLPSETANGLTAVDGVDGWSYLVEGQEYNGDGNDWIIAGNGNDLLEGGSGEDRLIGGNGDDTLLGGQGSDVLDGGYGINTYIFNKGDGADVIKNIYFYGDEPQSVVETHIILDVLPEDISVDVSSNYINLKINDTNDQLYIEDALSANVDLKTITFVDQTVWTITDILAQPLLGTEGDDYLVGIDARNNKIYGFEGNDNLYGAIGNDYLDGGTGDDYLDGSYGINTYVFNRGYGCDLINTPYLDENSPQIETHILMDVLPSDVLVEISYQDVFISLNNTDDLLEIIGVFTEFSAFKTITFADQTVWTIQDLQNSASMDSNQDESLTDLLNGLADNSNYEEYGYLFDELSDNQSLVGQLEGNNTQVLTDSLVLEESSDVDYQLNLLTIEDVQKSDIDVDKLLIITNANSDSENSQNVKNSLTQKYQFDEVEDQIVFDNTPFSMVNNISLWNTSFNQQIIA